MSARRLRKVLLTVHVCAAAGWLGGALTLVALGLSGRDTALDAMRTIDQYVMIPVSMLALLAGLTLALTSPWGLAKHYWVLTKLVLTIAVIVFAAVYLAQQVEAGSRAGATAGAVVLLAVLVTNVTLGVFKPWGRTARGRRAAGAAPARTPERVG
ncbi:hypothetical protein [Dactylosporangium sp. CA-092794]|uniref:hypothetical protein n=1 Tax=Dactylosporangium sp. CA-092794 TaxID=3239929 RepID=UPI003D902F0A